MVEFIPHGLVIQTLVPQTLFTTIALRQTGIFASASSFSSAKATMSPQSFITIILLPPRYIVNMTNLVVFIIIN